VRPALFVRVVAAVHRRCDHAYERSPQTLLSTSCVPTEFPLGRPDHGYGRTPA